MNWRDSKCRKTVSDVEAMPTYLDIEPGAGKVRFQIGVGYETVYRDKF